MNKSYALLFLFCVACIKSLFLPPSFVDASVILVLGIVFGYSEYKNNDKQIKKLQEEATQLRTEFNEVKEKVTSLKVIQGVKPSALGFK